MRSQQDQNVLQEVNKTYLVQCTVKVFEKIKNPFDVGNFELKVSFLLEGWGKNDFTNNGAYQSIMKDVELLTVEASNCQNQLRATKLGSNFVLDTTSFTCAGGEAGKGRKINFANSMSCLNIQICLQMPVPVMEEAPW